MLHCTFAWKPGLRCVQVDTNELNWAEISVQFSCVARTLQRERTDFSSVQLISVYFSSVQMSSVHFVRSVCTFTLHKCAVSARDFVARSGSVGYVTEEQDCSEGITAWHCCSRSPTRLHLSQGQLFIITCHKPCCFTARGGDGIIVFSVEALLTW